MLREANRSSRPTRSGWRRTRQTSIGRSGAARRGLHKHWRPAHSLGLLGVQPWGQPEGEHDDYDQWKQALGAGQSADVATVQVVPGFEIELLKSARPEEGSWISMAFDPQGRLTISREGRRKDNACCG